MRSITILVLFAVAIRLVGCGSSDEATSGGGSASGATTGTTGPGGSTSTTGTGSSVTGGMPVTGPFRLIAPMSTSTVTSQHPTLRWAPGGTDGATVELCADRACTSVVETKAVEYGTSWMTKTLAPGTYFWRAYSRTADVQAATPTPTWQFTVGARSAPLDASWGTTLDPNGDGYADLMIGAAYDGAGRVHWYPGGPAGLPTDPKSSLTNPDGTLSAFGLSVASAGDVNGDGYADVVIGAPGADDNAGRAYLYFGGPSGPAMEPSAILKRPDGNGNRFGGCVSSAGDVNGDGYADVLIGQGSTVGSSAISGTVYVYLGGPSGIASAADFTLSSPDGPGTYFGSSVASAGDMDGDGYADVVVGAYGAKALAGRAYFYLGSSSGLPNFPLPLESPGVSGAAFGISVASAGDVDGDGRADIVVGAAALGTPSDGTELNGQAYIYLGGSDFSIRPGTTLTGRVSERFGISVASAGDVNHDGYSDVVVGASVGGSAHLYLGSHSGLSTTESVTFASSAGTSGGFGISVVGAGDTNGDGASDIVVGAYRFSNSTGRAFVYLGGSSGPPSTPQIEIASPGGEFGGFGISVASAAVIRSNLRFQ